MTLLTDANPSAARAILRKMKGVKCWATVFGGGNTGSIHLHMGRKIRLDHERRNPNLPRAVRTHEGEHSLLVWSSWRMQQDGRIIASSESDNATLNEIRNVLNGRRVDEVWLYNDTWDLWVFFDNGLRLTVFCDLMFDEPGGIENWSYRAGDRWVLANTQGGLDITEPAS